MIHLLIPRTFAGHAPIARSAYHSFPQVWRCSISTMLNLGSSRREAPEPLPTCPRRSTWDYTRSRIALAPASKLAVRAQEEGMRDARRCSHLDHRPEG